MSGIKHCIVILLLIALAHPATAQRGCTDPKAINYNPAARSNDGSCRYAPAGVALTNARKLPVKLNENSGLIYTSGGLWTLNDSGNPADFYRIQESDGAIVQTVHVTNAANVDWEDITADDQYFYIGDFGNNADGNRTDLTIYRVKKKSVTTKAVINVTAETIRFSYQDQVIQHPVTNSANNTNFDCEAFFVKDNMIHLFTKDWLDGYTRHYTLPAAPGTQVAVPVETYNVQGLVTGAALAPDNKIALLGYSTNLTDLFMWVLTDYTGGKFFSGNKQKFDLGKSIDLADRSKDKGQTEGICFISNTTGYISNEQINRSMFGIPFKVPARLYAFSLPGAGVLPVTLTSFKAVYTLPVVELSWQAAAASSNAFFKIERSADGKSFSATGEVNAGAITKEAAYHYTDVKPLSGSSYYRLLQANNDGAINISNTIFVNVPVAGAGLKIDVSTPGTIVIDMGRAIAAPVQYILLSSNGSIVQKGTITGRQQRISVAGFATGNYFIKTGSDKAIRFQKR